MTETPGVAVVPTVIAAETSTPPTPASENPTEKLKPTPDPEVKATAPTPESKRTPEQIAELRRNEVQTVVHAGIARLGHEATTNEKFPVETRQAAKAYYELSTKLLNQPDGTFAEPIDTSSGNKLAVESIGGKRIASTDGEVISSIVGKKTIGNEVFLQCKIGNLIIPIPASEVLNAQLLAEEARLLEAFPAGSPQRQVMEAHMAHLKDRSVEPQVSETTIAEAATQSALITADSLRTFVSKNTEDGTPFQENLLNELSDQIIANPETAGRVLASLDNSQDRIDSFDTGIRKNNAEIGKLEAQIKAVPDETSPEAAQLNSHHRREIALMKQQNALREADRAELVAIQKALQEKGLSGDTGMIALVAQLYNGEMSADQALRVNKALEQGNVDELVTSLVGEISQEKLNKMGPEFKAALEKWGKMGISSLGIFLALLLIKGMNEN